MNHLGITRLFLGALCLAWAISASAEPLKAPAAPKPPNPSLIQVEDTPGLPRTLLIGDSISMGYTLQVRQLLKGKVNVHRPPLNCHTSRQILAELDSYLGDKSWDVILFNCGGHDFSYRKNDTYAPPPEGALTVPLDEYQKNLRAIVKRLKKTGAKLIWASTTPMSPEYMKQGFRLEKDLLAYNAAAAEIMKEERIPIDDLYTLTKPKAEALLKDGVHFKPKGYDVLAKSVVECIQTALCSAG